MAYRLLCTDIDGTLANSRGKLSARSRAAIRAAFERGLYVTLATGRPPVRLGDFAAALSGRVPLICGNGTLLTDSVSGETLLDEPMPREAALTLLRRAPAWATLVVWRGDRYWVGGNLIGAAHYRRLCGFPGGTLREYRESAGTGASKVLWLGPRALVSRALRKIQEKPVAGTAGFSSGAHTLEFVREDINKGSGLLRCAALLGLAPEEVIAVGDAMNDVPMLAAAGLGVAVANASECARRAAALTAPSNDEDGVAWVIENYMLRQEL